MAKAQSVSEVAQEYFSGSECPRPDAIDLDPKALGVALAGLGERNLLALKRPVAYGGPDVGEGEFRAFQEAIARFSGSLSFLQTQHQSAVSMIAKSSNGALRSEYLPGMANGERLVGIGFSQLRRAGPPIMRAEPVTGGWLLDGHVPWVTGAGFFPDFIVGAELPSGQALFVLLPLPGPHNNRGCAVRDGDARIQATKPMRLAAMESARTVALDVTRWFVAEHRCVDIKPKDWIVTNDRINIALQGFFALGCARAGLDVLQSAYQRRKKRFLHEAWTALDSELVELRESMIAAQAASGEETTSEKLNLRAHAITLCVRCAHAAVTATGGAANALDHPAQRIYREALVYTVSAQTEPIMEATLARLTARR